MLMHMCQFFMPKFQSAHKKILSQFYY
uniref:Uncharacterized protein n=1 Tax=Arundo donax TaxID=35708 RepID=A0A0A9BNC5_ARUDO